MFPQSTLPCETLMSQNKRLTTKLQGSVATYLMCGGVVNNQIKKCLLLSLPVKKASMSVNIRQSYKQARGCLVHVRARGHHTAERRCRNLFFIYYEIRTTR